MPTPVVMPKLGMTMQEGTVIEWPIALGNPVEKGEIVLIIESEKAEVEVEATDSGFFRHIYVDPDEVVPCGTVLAALTESPDEAFDPEAFRASQAGPAPRPAPAAAVPTPASASATEPGRPRSWACSSPRRATHCATRSSSWIPNVSRRSRRWSSSAV